MRKLIIVESPNKIMTIRGILGSSFTVAASVGHITEIKNGGVFNMGIDPDKKFKANYAISDDKKDVVKKLKEQVALADIIYIATDGDREGESIAWSLKKFLSIPEDKYHRITFNEITKKAVLNAIDNPRKIDEDLVDASQARQKLDKIVGFVLSPVAKKQVYAKSVGRVQSAGLKLIVDREDEINSFIIEYFFDLFLHFKKNKQDFKAKYLGTTTQEVKRIPTIEDVESIVKDCKQTNEYSIYNIEKKERTSSPKPPFTTSTFQQEVSSKLGIKVKSAMSFAQKLFEGIDIGGQHVGLITYIRTDSTELAEDFVTELSAYVKNTFGSKYYAPVRKGKKSENAQEGHEALRVLDLTMTPEKLSQYVTDNGLLKVYSIIYNRTLATAMANSIISETIYTIKNKEHLFSMSSKELIFDGYKTVYGAFEDKDDGEVTKENFIVGERLKDVFLEALEKQTTPPARFKEASFIKELEAKGIGRPSTFVTTVETVLSESRGYCELKDKFLVPTQKGINLVRFLDKSFSDIININYTSELEKELDLIAKHKLNELTFLTDFYTKLIESVDKVTPIKKVLEVSDKKCPNCGKDLVVKSGKWGPFLACPGYPKCKHIEKIKGE